MNFLYFQPNCDWDWSIENFTAAEFVLFIPLPLRRLFTPSLHSLTLYRLFSPGTTFPLPQSISLVPWDPRLPLYCAFLLTQIWILWSIGTSRLTELKQICSVLPWVPWGRLALTHQTKHGAHGFLFVPFVCGFKAESGCISADLTNL